MNDTQWRKKIFNPFVDTYNLLKIIQNADSTDNTADLWERYLTERQKLWEVYGENRYTVALVKMMMEAEKYIKEVNENEH